MTKAQSSLLTQVHTGHIGLRDYLFSRGVPDVTTPWCPCGLDKETPHHTICHCEDEGMMEEAGERPAALTDLRTRRDLGLALNDPDAASDILRWLMATGRLPEFKLACRLDRAQEAGANQSTTN